MFLLFYQKWRRAVQVDSSVKKSADLFAHPPRASTLLLVVCYFLLELLIGSSLDGRPC